MKQPTKAQSRRLEAIKTIGCLACRQMGYYDIPADAHHLLNGYRRGHECTVALCKWHHVGEDIQGVGKETLYKLLGPSLALNKREFHDTFGTDEELLMEQDRLYRLWQESFV